MADFDLNKPLGRVLLYEERNPCHVGFWGWVNCQYGVDIGSCWLCGFAGLRELEAWCDWIAQGVRLEYGPDGIRANAVGPGFIRKPVISNLQQDPEEMQQVVSMHPIGWFGTTQEVAELVIWLSSANASFVTGGYYPVDGDYLARPPLAICSFNSSAPLAHCVRRAAV